MIFYTQLPSTFIRSGWEDGRRGNDGNETTIRNAAASCSSYSNSP